MKKDKLKKWKVSVTTTAYKTIEAKDLVSAGDGVAKWAETNPYELWNWLSKESKIVASEFIEEVKDIQNE